MKSYFNSLGVFFKEFLIDDAVNRYLFPLTLVWFVADYLIWHIYLSSPDIVVAIKIGIYPVKLLLVVLVINSFLAISSYKKEKEITYLLLIGNLLSVALVLILEIYYLLHQ